MTMTAIEGRGPRLVLEDFFQGESRAWGLFQDRFGAIRRQFGVAIRGHWNASEATLTLEEDFLYDDGETEQRRWVLHKTGPDSYEGSAADVAGKASGRISGNAFHWTYDFNLRVGKGRMRVHFDDWMVLQPDGALLNVARVSKLGIVVGTASIFFLRADALAAKQSLASQAAE